MSYHEFYSVFILNDEELSRPIRFTIFYVRFTIYMASTSVFSQILTFL